MESMDKSCSYAGKDLRCSSKEPLKLEIRRAEESRFEDSQVVQEIETCVGVCARSRCPVC